MSEHSLLELLEEEKKVLSSWKTAKRYSKEYLEQSKDDPRYIELACKHTKALQDYEKDLKRIRKEIAKYILSSVLLSTVDEW